MKQPDKLPRTLHRQFLSFLDNHPPQAFSNSLRRLLLDYMASEADLPTDFTRFLWSLNDLFDLLETAAEELQKKGLSIVPDKESKKIKITGK